MKKNAQETAILRVQNLGVKFRGDGADVLAVRNASFEIPEGKTLGLVGESGCGKSVTALSILRLVPPAGTISGGEVLYRGKNLLAMSVDDICAVRGKEIAMIFQEPISALNPVFTIGYQVAESVKKHFGASGKEARDRTVELLQKVGIPNPGRRFHSYPHEFSGGMRQRAMIAMALAASPSVLIADEPTTALDVTIQSQILDLLLSIQESQKMSLLLITHNLGIVANLADHIAIMYAGEIVESGKIKDIFSGPSHPYTRGLFEAIPKIGAMKKKLAAIPGTVPTLTAEPSGCVFHPRCPMGIPECMEKPVEMVNAGRGHYARCIRVKAGLKN